MTRQAAIRARFARLLEQGAVPLSTGSSAWLATLQPLLDAGVVAEERAGAGRRLRVRDEAALRAFLAQRYPDATTTAGASSRIRGVARFRDTKAFASDEPEIVCLRAWRAGGLTRSGESVQVAEATAKHGLFGFLLASESPYRLSGPCALVENPAVFARIEALKLPVSLAIYGQGRVSKRRLDWLASTDAPDFTLLHLPDYDPVGLSEFVRLRARLGSRVRLHVPGDLAARFERYSNRALLQRPNSQSLLAKLRSCPVPEIQPILTLMDRHNAGLEQEALFLERPEVLLD